MTGSALPSRQPHRNIFAGGPPSVLAAVLPRIPEIGRSPRYPFGGGGGRLTGVPGARTGARGS